MDNTKGIGKPKDDPSVKKGKNYFLGVGINDYSAGWTILYNACGAYFLGIPPEVTKSKCFNKIVQSSNDKNLILRILY